MKRFLEKLDNKLINRRDKKRARKEYIPATPEAVMRLVVDGMKYGSRTRKEWLDEFPNGMTDEEFSKLSETDQIRYTMMRGGSL